MKKNPIVIVVATGIGAAIFFVLGRFASIPLPFPPDTYFQIQMAVLALFAVLFGPIPGVLIGFVGHLLIDFSFGTPWFSWIIASAVVGLIIGFAGGGLRKSLNNGTFAVKDLVWFNIIQLIANLIAWLGVAPLLDVLLYKESYTKSLTQASVAALINIVACAIIGTLLIWLYSKTKVKSGSLSKE